MPAKGGKMLESSIVIPVYNKWDLTRHCLKSIAAHTDTSKIEIIVVDNASTDATQKGCSFLGKQLFGDAFHYIRNSINRNFAGASNQGAELAQGEFIIFLNNDTEVQSGWYQPLINDFSTYPDIAATGPLLVYPDETPLGRTVQHLGVFVSPSYSVGHLYEGIPTASPLAQKRRFFQAITGACLVIKKSLFIETGKFDERFINGFEDVDLCARLREKGYRLTVNPTAVVIHHESQTPGRHAHEKDNSRLLAEKSLSIFVPDWHVHTVNDGLIPGVNDWLLYQNMLPEKVAARLAPILEKAGIADIRELLVAYPYWQDGWEKAMNLVDDIQEKIAVLRPFFKLFPNTRNAFAAYSLGRQSGDRALANQGVSFMRSFADEPANYLHRARLIEKFCRKIGLDEVAERHLEWIDNYGRFSGETYPEFARAFIGMAREVGLALNPNDDNAYAIWTFGNIPEWREQGPRENAFSILMPVYNPRPEHFRAALDSVLVQDHDNWELCIADDASTNPEVSKIIREYMARDKRIKAVFRSENGHIAEATNSALEIAGYPWCVLMDQDDLIASDALSVMDDAISARPDGMLFYSDEDKIVEDGYFFQPHFKKGRWDRELLASQNFVCHLAAYRTERLREIGGFRKGFEGAQDHDMLLRYVAGLDESALLHIPRVLYHWRSHEQSTSMHIGAKGYAFANARKAVQEWLDQTCPGAVVDENPVVQWTRVRYPLPGEKPLASILCRIRTNSFEPAAFARTVEKTTAYPHEIVFICPPEDKDFWETMMPGSCRIATSYSDASMKAEGEILGFMEPKLAGASEEWLEEIASSLWRPDVGAVGGKVIIDEKSMAHAGYMVDASGVLKPLFRNFPARQIRYFGWSILPRTVDALDEFCLFTRKDVFMKNGGLDPDMGAWALQDYCLRLGQKGLRSVWWPYAQLFLEPGGNTGESAPETFRRKWDGVVPPFNQNIMINGEDFSLCTD